MVINIYCETGYLPPLKKFTRETNASIAIMHLQKSECAMHSLFMFVFISRSSWSISSFCYGEKTK